MVQNNGYPNEHLLLLGHLHSNIKPSNQKNKVHQKTRIKNDDALMCLTYLQLHNAKHWKQINDLLVPQQPICDS